MKLHINGWSKKEGCKILNFQKVKFFSIFDDSINMTLHGEPIILNLIVEK